MNAVVTPLSQAMRDDALVSRRELKALMKRSNRPGLIRLFWWVVLLCCTSALIWSSANSLYLLIPAMFIHGIVVVHHFALQHECSHYTAFKSRRLCRVLANLCGFILIIPPLFFRYEHCDHHTYTNIDGRDPEKIDLPDSLLHYLVYLSAIPYWRSQIGGLLRRASGKITREENRFIPVTERPAIINESRIMLVAYALLLIIVIAFNWTWPILYWWLPMFMAEPVMRFIRMTEHVGRPQVPDMRINTRSNIVSAPWRFLAWNMNYHAEHHYASSVPFHALEALHKKLKEHVYVEPDGYVNAHRDIYRQVTQGPAAPDKLPR